MSRRKAATPIDAQRLKEVVAKPGADPQLDAWAAKLLAQADKFRETRKPDPLDTWLPT